jgi:hypothetical protein
MGVAGEEGRGRGSRGMRWLWGEGEVTRGAMVSGCIGGGARLCCSIHENCCLRELEEKEKREKKKREKERKRKGKKIGIFFKPGNFRGEK